MNPPATQVRQTGRANRRSKRLKLIVPVEVFAFEGEAVSLREATRMLSVNAHGGMLVLEMSVRPGQVIRVVNQKTAEQQDCRVVNVETAAGGRWAVGIEFTGPAADFWKISFPPLAGRLASSSRN